jgi:ferredoxin-NAD(P)+ reductase (naphthalene dioxygenase ferredoxin-specific)
MVSFLLIQKLMELLVHPGNLRLLIQSGQNLLDVLRANAVPISYSCMSGRCGTCRCKLTQGGVRHSGPETGRPGRDQDTYVLACQSVLIDSCTIEIPDTDEVIVHPARVIKGTVLSIEQLTADIQRILIKPAKPLDFSPGQYALLQFTSDHIRPYSWAGLPNDSAMEFQIRQVYGGRVTGYVFSSLQPGDVVRISGPLGTAYLRRKHTGPILCAGGGTGIAPIVSIVRGAIVAGMRNPIHLYFGVRSQEDRYDLDRLKQLAIEHGHIRLHVVIATGAVSDGERSGLVTDAIRKDFLQLQDFIGYFCGAPAMVESLNSLVQSMGMPLEKIHADAFYPSGI